MYARALGWAGVAYVLCHHLGLLPAGLGSGPSDTRWADWLDLAVPWLVLAPAAVGFGWRHRRDLAGILWVGYPPAVVVLIGALVVATT